MPTVDESVSQAIDVFHLPSGADVSDYEIYEVATSDGVKRCAIRDWMAQR